jgi:hypothetical protein
MAAIAHGWNPPSSSGIHIPRSVAKDFNAADAKLGRQKDLAERIGKKK